jgi:hypothetical protein
MNLRPLAAAHRIYHSSAAASYVALPEVGN